MKRAVPQPKLLTHLDRRTHLRILNWKPWVRLGACTALQAGTILPGVDPGFRVFSKFNI